jgi:hypothetical protein
MGWWRFTGAMLAALTAPHADVAACDRAMEQLARASRLGSALHRASWIIRAAWSGSLARSASAALGGLLSPLRVRGWIAAVAGATALGLTAIKPVPAGPLSWVAPSLLVVAGVLTMLMAGPLARAIANRTS